MIESVTVILNFQIYKVVYKHVFIICAKTIY